MEGYKPQLYDTLAFEPLAASHALDCNAIHANSETRQISLGQNREQGYFCKMKTKNPVPSSVSLENALEMEADKLSGKRVVLMIDNKIIEKRE